MSAFSFLSHSYFQSLLTYLLRHVLFSFGLTMLPSQRAAARDSLGVWYFEVWRNYCQWFLQEDENMQTWLRCEWSAREKRYQQSGQDSKKVIALRRQLGLEMAPIFHEEDRKFHLNRFLGNSVRLEGISKDKQREA